MPLRRPPKPVPSVVAARARPAEQRSDLVEKVRQKLREMRDKEAQRKDLEERSRKLSAELEEMRRKTLVDMFNEAGIDKLGLPAEGNLPAYDAEEKPYYHANIRSDWEQEKKDAAFGWLDKNGYGDLVKNVFVVVVDRDDHEMARDVEKALDEAGVDYQREQTVPWNTLTAFVREQIEAGETLPLELLGATVGRVVVLKPRRS